MSADDAVMTVLACFVRAKDAIELTFSATSASQIVSAVLQERMPREGRCLNGLEYFVHGIGYTVVMPSGGQVHFDDGGHADVFSVYDIEQFLETAGYSDVPQIDEIRIACLRLESRGFLVQSNRRFSMPDRNKIRDVEGA